MFTRAVIKVKEDPDGERAEVSSPPRSGLLRRIRRSVITCIFIHYLLWLPAAVCAISLGAWLAFHSVTAVCTALAISALLYAPSFLDGSHFKLGRPWDAFRHWRGWREGHEYVGLRVVRTKKLAAGRPYIFGWHPHGILILSRLSMYGGIFEALFPGIETRALGATPIFFWPGSREISLWLGAVDASVSVARRVLEAGLSIVVYPGGSREIFKTDKRSRETVLELKERTGFVRLAMQYGAPLVPVVVYGERSAYTRIDMPAWLRDLCLRTLRVPILLFFGRFGLLPHKLALGVVFGAPLEVEHVPDIAKDDPRVLAAHARYVEALRTLWETHKAEFGYGPDETLSIR